MVSAAIGLGLAILSGRWRAVAIGTGVVLLFVAPIACVPVLFGLGARVVGRRVLSPRNGDNEEAQLAELAALGLAAGLSFPAAVEAATDAVPGSESARLRQAARIPVDPACPSSDDPGLLRVARRALDTGAPLAPSVSGYATALRKDERSRQLAAARRLPVKLLFPLALLILPGFLLLTVGPAVLGSLQRLGL
jgi:hypothetical protein